MKNYREFLKSSISRSSIMSNILDNLDSVIEEQLGKFIIEYNKKFEREPSEYEKEAQKLNLVYDLVNSIEKYTKSTDELIYFNVSVSKKGNFEFIGKIKRDNNVYNLETEVIYAGGYNIQALHYRYITKTDLPKTGESTLTNQFKEKIKALDKNEKILKEISSYENRIENVKNALNKEDYTENQVIDILRREDADDYFFKHEKLDWAEMVRRGSDRNYKDEQDFLDKKEEYRKSKIDFWLNMNTYSTKQKEVAIKEYNKQIDKLKSKLQY